MRTARAASNTRRKSRLRAGRTNAMAPTSNDRESVQAPGYFLDQRLHGPTGNFLLVDSRRLDLHPAGSRLQGGLVLDAHAEAAALGESDQSRNRQWLLGGTLRLKFNPGHVAHPMG